MATDGRLTYADLDRSIERVAGTLHELGVRKGDVVGISLRNATPVVISFYAILRLGAIWLGINKQLAPPEKRYILEDASATLFLTEGAGDRRDEDLGLSKLHTLVAGGDSDAWERSGSHTSPQYERASVGLDDPAALAYTSGTTGRPKGVVHSHRNLLLPGAVLAHERGLGPELRKGDCAALTILNMHITSTLLVAQVGGTQIAMDRVDPVGVAEWIRRERVNTCFAVPTLLYGLAKSPHVTYDDLSSLSDVWTGGSFLPTSVRRSFEDRFDVSVSATYGLTEAPAIVTMERRGSGDRHSSGRPLPHLLVEVRDDDDRILSARETGEITVRAATDGRWADLYRPMLGYRNRPEAINVTVCDGTLYTGDIGWFDEAGDLHVTDRRNALILRGGANIYPAEVERIILQVDGVSGASVVGVPDERLGQRVAAGVELEAGRDLDAEYLCSACERDLAKYKVPERWRFGRLPRNAMGKVMRSEVERWFSEDSKP